MPDWLGFLEQGIFGDLGTMIDNIYKSGFEFVESQNLITKAGILALSAIIGILGTFSLIKKLSKLIFVVVVVFVVWYVLTNPGTLPF